MSKNPATQWYWSDWFRETGLRKGTFAVRGYWIDMLHHMHFAKKRGILCGTREEIARTLGCCRRTSDRHLDYLAAEGVCDLTESEGIVTITNRRMVRESWLGQIRAESGSKGGSKKQANLLAKGVAKPSPPSPNLQSPKKEKRVPSKTQEPCRAQPDDAPPFADIVTHLNQKTGKAFKPATKGTQAHIRARWAEGYRLEDFKRVINTKTAQWADDEKMSAFLRPDTLFGTKFEAYKNEEPNVKKRWEDLIPGD